MEKERGTWIEGIQKRYWGGPQTLACTSSGKESELKEEGWNTIDELLL
jgi:hypothetical protein